MTKNDDFDKVFNSTMSKYMGQRVIRVSFLGSSAASVGPFIFLGRGLKNDEWGRKTLRHEHGHYLDYKDLGFFKFFLGIGLPSVINASKKPEKRRIVGYYNQPWEIRADNLAGVTRDEHTEEAHALSDAYYKYLKFLRVTGWFEFLFKDLWAFIRHDFKALEKSNSMKHGQYRFLSTLQRNELMSIALQKSPLLDGVYINSYDVDSYDEEEIKIEYGRNIVAFHGTVSDSANGAIITGFFRRSMFNRAFFWLLRAFLLLFTGLAVLHFDYGYFQTAGFVNISSSTPVLIICPIMFMITFLVEWIAKSWVKEGKEVILEFIKKELNAEILND